MRLARLSCCCVSVLAAMVTFPGLEMAGYCQVVPAATGSATFTSAGTAAGAVATISASAPAPKINGINFSLQSSSQHSSVTGWYSLLTPDLSYRFNQHFSFDTSVPYYITYQNYVQVKSGTTTTDLLERTSQLLGDTTASGHYETDLGDFSASLSASGAFPTGNQRFGLTANTPTYNVTGHVDYSIGPFSPDVEIGEGNSSSLVNRGVKKGYTAVGPLANFQAGSSIDLPFKSSLDLEAYEDLPLGNQNVYGTVTRVNKKGKTVTRQVLTGTGVAEDNGFNSGLDVPILPHLTLACTYERSLIQSTDVVGIALTWTARVPSKQTSTH
jgi:hypothetical protein